MSKELETYMFDGRNPATESEKLVVKLLVDLDEMTEGFFNLHKATVDKRELWGILQNTSVAYMSNVISKAVENVKESNRLEYIEMNEFLIGRYMKRIKEKIKEKK